MYSPSQTTLFDFCPFKWYLQRKKGVTIRGATRKEPAAVFGRAFGNAFSVYYRQNKAQSLSTITDFALTEFDQGIKELGELPEELVTTITKYRVSLEKAIVKWYSNDPIPPGWTITGIEMKADEHDTSYLDLAGVDHNGLPFVWDNKCKMYCPANKVIYEVQEYADSWQLYHYAWSYANRIGEPVHTYCIYFVVGSPTVRAELHQFGVDPEHLETWYHSAVQKWARMEEAEQRLEELFKQYGPYPPIEEVTKYIEQSTQHRDRWGKCEMYEPCRVGKGQPMHSHYILFPEEPK